MKHLILKRFGLTAGTVAVTFGLAVVPAAAVATRPGVEAPAVTAGSAANDAKSQAKLKVIITRGNKEVDRRLKTLNTLSIKITGAKKLSSANKTALNDEVRTEISGLNDLKQKLDADTDLATAQADAQDIFSGYRVYALIVPKVQLVKTADDLQTAADRLTALSSKLQTRIDTAKKQGKDVASLQSTLNDMIAKTKDARTISSAVELNIINLQPGDYNSNRSIMSDNRNTLKTAQSDIKAATADARTIVSSLLKQ